MFEKATKMKLRFAYKGSSSVEDLWNLRVEELDAIYQELRAEQRAAASESLLKQSGVDKVLSLRINIVKHIVEVKLEAKDRLERRAESRAKRQRIAALVAEKQDEALKGKSLDELKELMAGFEDEDDDE